MAISSPEARFHLVEADQRKWAFLKHVVRELALKATVHGDRLHRALDRFPPAVQLDLVVSRAVGKPEQWVPTLKAHLAEGARIALFQATEEVPEIDDFHHVTTFRLPRGESHRLVVLSFHVEQR
jgi:16S rRNA G527 N7-methylase RsmG